MSDDDIIHRGKTFVVRKASEADGPALCALFKKVHLKSDLDLAQERDPDFFALPRLHTDRFDVWMGENDRGTLGGCGTLALRPGWFDGAIHNVGYLSDLRVVPGFKAPGGMPLMFKLALERARDRDGAELFYTVIFDSNRIARRALVGRDDRRRKDQPRYFAMTPFQMTSVQFTFKKGRPSRPITNATERDLPELVELLAAGGQRRTMGEVVSVELLQKRFATWPGLSLSSFLLARDATGRLVGACAPWDSEPVKRTRVLGYHGSMRWVRLGFDLGAKIFRYPALPEPGDCFRFAFLSHLEIVDDDPGVLRDLLLAAYGQLRDRGLHFMSAMVPTGSPLEPAFTGFSVTRTPMTIYAVTLPGSRYDGRDFRTLLPGFEMALS